MSEIKFLEMNELTTENFDGDLMSFTAPVSGYWYVKNAILKLEAGEKLKIPKKMLKGFEICLLE